MKKEILDENPTELFDIVDTSNVLLNNVNNTADLKIDAKISSMYSEVYLKLFKRNVNGKLISIDNFVEFVNSDKSKDWYKQVKSHSKGFSVISFIDFDLMSIKKERRCKRLKIEIKKAEAPDENTQTETVEQSGFINKVLAEINEKGPRPYYLTVIDCESFTKTIENVFDLSIAIRSKQLVLIVRDDILLIDYFRESDTNYNEHIIEEFEYTRYLEIVNKIKGANF